MMKRVEQFSALGQKDRLAIFQLLVRAGPQGNCVEDIKRRWKKPGSTLSHHLDALTRSRLLSARRVGRFIFYAVNWSETAALIRFLTEDCCAEMHTKLAAPATCFENIDIEPTRIYSVAQSKEILAEVGLDSDELAAQVDNKFMSAFVRARKPTRNE